ncbi:MAG TPA: lysine transporter LysE, partial [Alphaproteobacteria bacterium]|nr:lysine transporter LysE [Alphaproteobacteria bacterium]
MFDGVINGVLIGMLVAAPVGPVNVICIQRTLRLGRISGFLAGLGAVLGDTIFALAASLQFVAISSFLKS